MPREYVCEVCGDAFLGRPDRPWAILTNKRYVTEKEATTA